MKPTIAFDADALLAALLSPSHTAGRLLQLASLGIYDAHIGPAVLADAERLAREGVGGRVVTDAELLAFRAAIAELIAKGDVAPTGATRCGAGGTLPDALLTALLAGDEPAGSDPG